MRTIATLLALLPASALGMEFYKSHDGEGTYYGSGGSGGGNCVLRNPVPAIYSGLTPVAMNNAQYKGSCGACVLIRGNGDGSGGSPITGEIKGYVADKCPECAHGDVDLAMDGDGRWQTTFEFVPCPVGEKMSYKYEGSNPSYVKVQPRGCSTPPSKVSVDGVGATFTDDNFWVAHGSFGASVKIDTWTTAGMHYQDTVTRMDEGVAYGGAAKAPSIAKSGTLNLVAASSGDGGSQGGGGQSGGSCTAEYQRCAGAEGHPHVEYKACCGDWECVNHADVGWGKQCRPKGY